MNKYFFRRISSRSDCFWFTVDRKIIKERGKLARINSFVFSLLILILTSEATKNIILSSNSFPILRRCFIIFPSNYCWKWFRRFCLCCSGVVHHWLPVCWSCSRDYRDWRASLRFLARTCRCDRERWSLSTSFFFLTEPPSTASVVGVGVAVLLRFALSLSVVG